MQQTEGCAHAENQMQRFSICDAPTTRFQGSKRKILPWIWEHLAPRSFDSVLDVFGGTGSVSYLFKRMGKQVTYNDHMRWNYLIGTALIENDSRRLSEAEIEMLIEPVTRADGDFVTRAFRGMYFTERENLWIDALISRIDQIAGNPEDVKYKVALAYYGLFQTCLVKRPFNLFHRANLSIRTADVERSFGNKTTWEKPFAKHFRSFVEEINSFVLRGKHPCCAVNHDAAEIPEGDYDLVYLDPPYVKRGAPNETANYLRCYHFLEGLARYRDWPGLIDYSNRLQPITVPKETEWTDPEKNVPAFGNLFDKFADSIIAISYKKFGCPSIDTLVRMLERRRKKVSVHSRHYKYALNQQNGSAKLNRECLIIAE
jgi:adenine-specific DNA-methyltransferase